MSETVTVTMTRDKVTPGTIRYAEDQPDETQPLAIGTLYVKKHTAAQLGSPDTITVTVTAA